MAFGFEPRGNERLLLGLQRPSPRLPGAWRRGAWTWSTVVHVLVVASLTAIEPASRSVSLPRMEQPATRLTWVSTATVPGALAGTAKGGGGGGDARPPRITAVPAAPAPVQTPADEPSPLASAPMPTVALTSELPVLAHTRGAAASLAVASSVRLKAGSAEGSSEGEGRGEGSGGGYGNGQGTGTGAGMGPGVGPGFGGGAGGGVYRPGGGVTTPVLVRRVLPVYPEEAVQLRTQGSVMLEVVVRRDGIPDDIRVLRPVDRGPLDREAERTVQQWRFRPGTKNGRAVDVLITVIVDFILY